jgi:hypothetical protein
MRKYRCVKNTYLYKTEELVVEAENEQAAYEMVNDEENLSGIVVTVKVISGDVAFECYEIEEESNTSPEQNLQSENMQKD